MKETEQVETGETAAPPRRSRVSQTRRQRVVVIEKDDQAAERHLSPLERHRAGKALRDKVPRESHAEWKPRSDRPDPIDLLIASDKGRLPELVPIRHSRMLTSPFAFLRGSALIMADDLSQTPVSGIRVQACGDCHLLNFGAFATPERNMIFDINDFDETLPAPWEWDLKRLVASIVVAGRYVDLKEGDSLRAATAAARSYRRAMARFANMRVLEVWYDHLDLEEALATLPKALQKRARMRVEKARARATVEHEFPKLVSRNGGQPRIKDAPPLIFHPQGQRSKEGRETAHAALQMYRDSLPEHLKVLADRFELYDFAIKVVGVGSVGTTCQIALLMASNRDPLFMQIKQANASVFEPYAGASSYPNHGQRVVVGQRMMQAASDMLLGWWINTSSGHHFYARQLRDMKLTPNIESMDAEVLRIYAKWCGSTLAKAHARTGDAAMISGYLGNSPVFDDAMEQFASGYADQTQSDHRAMRKAVRDGRLEVASE